MTERKGTWTYELDSFLWTELLILKGELQSLLPYLRWYFCFLCIWLWKALGIHPLTINIHPLTLTMLYLVNKKMHRSFKSLIGQKRNKSDHFSTNSGYIRILTFLCQRSLFHNSLKNDLTPPDTGTCLPTGSTRRLPSAFDIAEAHDNLRLVDAADAASSQGIMIVHVT